MTLNMVDIVGSWSAFMPELWLLSAICVLLLVDCYGPTGHKSFLVYGLTQVTLIGAVSLIIFIWPNGGVAFNQMFLADKIALISKVVICLATAVTLVYAREYIHARDFFKSEYYLLTLSSVLGMFIMVSGAHMLTLYLGVELLSFSLYALIAMRRDSTVAAEAALKLFVMGAIGSGLFLYGITMVYGATGQMSLAGIAQFIAQQSAVNQPISMILLLGLVFIIAGLAFKLGAVPFHMWVPDVYQGAPTSVTTFISTAPKVAGFAIIARLLVDAFPLLYAEWQQLWVVIAIASMALGNIVAIAQTNLKRMLGYSAIAHMGFFLLGILAGKEAGNGAALFYMVAYVIMSLGAFGMIILMSRAGIEAENIEDFRGLNKTHPWYAFIMLLFMFSLAGVPPTVGFYAKLSVLKAVIDINMVWLAGVAVFFSIIGAYYYLRVVKTMYFDAPNQVVETALKVPVDLRFVLTLNGLAILGLGIFPAGLMALCQHVFVSH